MVSGSWCNTSGHLPTGNQELEISDMCFVHLLINVLSMKIGSNLMKQTAHPMSWLRDEHAEYLFLY